MTEEIARLSKIAASDEDALVCDGCGRCYVDDHDALSESCDHCGRFKQRMEWATVCDVAKDAAARMLDLQAQSVRFAESLHYLFLYQGEKHCVNADVVAAVQEARELLGVSQ